MEIDFENEPRAIRLLNRIAEANRIRESTVSDIGIFWVRSDKTLIILSTPWTDTFGEYGMYDIGVSHYKYWENIKTRYGLGDLDYEDLPRGRIIYDKPSNTFKVYGKSTVLKMPEIRSTIIRTFNLPLNNTKFMKDIHYENETVVF